MLLGASVNSGICKIKTEKKVKKELKSGQESEVTIDALTLEATITANFAPIAHVFYILFTTELTSEVIIPSHILSPTFIDVFLDVLFTRIIPTKAP